MPEITIAKQISENLYNFLIKNNIDKVLESKIKELNDMQKVDIAAEYEKEEVSDDSGIGYLFFRCLCGQRENAGLTKHVFCSFTVSLKFYRCHFCGLIPSDGPCL